MVYELQFNNGDVTDGQAVFTVRLWCQFDVCTPHACLCQGPLPSPSPGVAKCLLFPLSAPPGRTVPLSALCYPLGEVTGCGSPGALSRMEVGAA